MSDWTGIFRREALDTHRARADAMGEPLRLLPGWVSWTYPILLLVSSSVLIFIVVFHVSQYASGPSVVRVAGRVDISSPVAAVIESVCVVPGAQVQRGDVLFCLEATAARLALDKLMAEFDGALVSHLRDLEDPSARQQLVSVRSQIGELSSQLESTRIRATSDGTIDDLRVRVGQAVLPGQVAITVRRGELEAYVLAAVPGRHRPQLRPGLQAWFEVDGYAHTILPVTLHRVEAAVIGPTEAGHFFGSDIKDALPLSGSVALLYAELPAPVFYDAEKAYAFHDGMQGRLRVRIKSERLMSVLIPWLSRTSSRHGT